MSKRILKTKLCDMLGIEYPILSAGMGPTLIGETTGAPVELVVAVSEAGGLGVLGGSGYTVDELQKAIREIKKQTDKPYGVDLLLPKYLHDTRRHGNGGHSRRAYHRVDLLLREQVHELGEQYARTCSTGERDDSQHEDEQSLRL